MKVKISDSSLKKIIREGKVGYHAIGNNLYIRISKERSGFWVFRYTFNEKRKEISFGSYPEIPLAEARLRASKFKIDVQNGINLEAEKKPSK
ncbi:Arm DNA-binding domain-containing protein [Catenovulum sediminis]|uniref:Arm DNA-binding domain-containing protein n=1 Tax=Catenovulum sediminis TaxID=1740262 RepID=UPI00117FC431|nr:Arm DNA-binding domain-containing protein [Catenovulum sediminis]